MLHPAHQDRSRSLERPKRNRRPQEEKTPRVDPDGRRQYFVFTQGFRQGQEK